MNKIRLMSKVALHNSAYIFFPFLLVFLEWPPQQIHIPRIYHRNGKETSGTGSCTSWWWWQWRSGTAGQGHTDVKGVLTRRRRRQCRQTLSRLIIQTIEEKEIIYLPWHYQGGYSPAPFTKMDYNDTSPRSKDTRYSIPLARFSNNQFLVKASLLFVVLTNNLQITFSYICIFWWFGRTFPHGKSLVSLTLAAFLFSGRSSHRHFYYRLLRFVYKDVILLLKANVLSTDHWALGISCQSLLSDFYNFYFMLFELLLLIVPFNPVHTIPNRPHVSGSASRNKLLFETMYSAMANQLRVWQTNFACTAVL